ncbi:MAG: hypothetical protein DLM61_07270 [Pseudonocardiales bacterium]|nr:MAG: hypothetical protein DLM61_07270 [Pseudonocardiales bacterium]
MSRRLFTAIAAAVSMLGLAACTSSTGTHTQSPPSSSASGSSTASESSSPPPTGTSPTVSPTEKAAVAAYVAFRTAAHNAEKNPADTAREAALKAYAVDPALGHEGGSLISYVTGDIAWGGTPPAARVSVTAVQPASKPYPMVTLRDCPTAAPSWKPYNIKTHKPVPVQFPGSTAPPPHAITATVIYYRSRWLVQTSVTEVKKTCAPS